MFEYLDSIFYYDETSPSCVRWKIVPKTQKRCEIGDPVGSINNNTWVVYYGKMHIRVKKIVWILCNKVNMFSNFRLFHDNLDSLDNRISNLSESRSKIILEPATHPDSSAFCVYKHILDGVVVYIGSGTMGKRPYDKDCRASNHTEIFESLTVEIIAENLTKRESVLLEQSLYEFHKETLLNKVKPSLTKPIEYDRVSKFVEYDESSPTCLRWLVDVVSGRGRKMSRVGDTAGGTKKKYSNIQIKGIVYQTHRVVWCLNSKEDFDSNMVIDHIDRNPLNNKISNLRLSTWSNNSLNKELSKHNKTGVSGVYWCNRDNVWIVINSLSGDTKRKTFNPLRLYPHEDSTQAKEHTFVDAVNYRDVFLESVGAT